MFSHLQSPLSTTVRKSKALQEEVALSKSALISSAVEYEVDSPTYTLKGSHWQKDKKNLHLNFAWLEMLTTIPGNLMTLIKKKKEHN